MEEALRSASRGADKGKSASGFGRALRGSERGRMRWCAGYSDELCGCPPRGSARARTTRQSAEEAGSGRGSHSMAECGGALRGVLRGADTGKSPSGFGRALRGSEKLVPGIAGNLEERALRLTEVAPCEEKK